MQIPFFKKRKEKTEARTGSKEALEKHYKQPSLLPFLAGSVALHAAVILGNGISPSILGCEDGKENAPSAEDIAEKLDDLDAVSISEQELELAVSEAASLASLTYQGEPEEERQQRVRVTAEKLSRLYKERLVAFDKQLFADLQSDGEFSGSYEDFLIKTAVYTANIEVFSGGKTYGWKKASDAEKTFAAYHAYAEHALSLLPPETDELTKINTIQRAIRFYGMVTKYRTKAGRFDHVLFEKKGNCESISHVSFALVQRHVTPNYLYASYVGHLNTAYKEKDGKLFIFDNTRRDNEGKEEETDLALLLPPAVIQMQYLLKRGFEKEDFPPPLQEYWDKKKAEGAGGAVSDSILGGDIPSLGLCPDGSESCFAEDVEFDLYEGSEDLGRPETKEQSSLSFFINRVLIPQIPDEEKGKGKVFYLEPTFLTKKEKIKAELDRRLKTSEVNDLDIYDLLGLQRIIPMIWKGEHDDFLNRRLPKLIRAAETREWETIQQEAAQAGDDPDKIRQVNYKLQDYVIKFRKIPDELFVLPRAVLKDAFYQLFNRPAVATDEILKKHFPTDPDFGQNIQVWYFGIKSLSQEIFERLRPLTNQSANVLNMPDLKVEDAETARRIKGLFADNPDSLVIGPITSEEAAREIASIPLNSVLSVYTEGPLPPPAVLRRLAEFRGPKLSFSYVKEEPTPEQIQAISAFQGGLGIYTSANFTQTSNFSMLKNAQVQHVHISTGGEITDEAARAAVLAAPKVTVVVETSGRLPPESFIQEVEKSRNADKQYAYFLLFHHFTEDMAAGIAQHLSKRETSDYKNFSRVSPAAARALTEHLRSLDENIIFDSGTDPKTIETLTGIIPANSYNGFELSGSFSPEQLRPIVEKFASPRVAMKGNLDGRMARELARVTYALNLEVDGVITEEAAEALKSFRGVELMLHMGKGGDGIFPPEVTRHLGEVLAYVKLDGFITEEAALFLLPKYRNHKLQFSSQENSTELMKRLLAEEDAFVLHK